MPWFAVDDGFAGHPKLLALETGPRYAEAVALWTIAGAWCASQLTDGAVPAGALRRLVPFPARAAAAELVRVGLWTVSEAGYQFRDWKDYQPTREEVEASRMASASRSRKYRRKVKERDATVTRDATRDDTAPSRVSHALPTHPIPTTTPPGGGVSRARRRKSPPPPPAPESLSTPDTANAVADSRPEKAPPGPANDQPATTLAPAPVTALPAPPTGAGTEAFLRSLSPTPERDRAALDVLSRARQAAGGAPLVPSSHADRDAIARLGEWSAAMPAGSLERAAAAFWSAKGAGAPLRWLADDDPGKWLATKPARTKRSEFRACPPSDVFADNTSELFAIGGES